MKAEQQEPKKARGRSMDAGKKKELEVRAHTEGYGYYIAYVGGGQVPGKLAGRYTSTSAAQRALDLFNKGK